MLSEFLYLKDELIASFIVSLIYEADIDEPILYISELYNSQFYDDVYNIIWQTYFDFYYLTNPTIVSLIHDTITKDKAEKSLENIHHIIKHLFKLDKSIPVFLLHQQVKIYGSNHKFTVFRGKKPKILEKYNDVSHKIIQSLEKFNWTNITHFISSVKEEELPVIFTDIHNYLIDKKKKKTLDISLDYYNKKHMLLSLILINYCKDTSEKRTIDKIVIEYDTPNYEVIPRKLLETNRQITIHNEVIGAFNLYRHSVSRKELFQQLWYNWEYFCKECPLWNERFSECKVIFDDEKKKPIFPNDDLLEEFYEKYNLEPDEQSSDIIDHSHVDLNNITSKEFLCKLLIHLDSSSVEIPKTLIEFFVEFETNITNKYII
jgi:hypothetical protein